MKELFAVRLKNARIMAGLSLQNLADKLDNIVTRQALNKYEHGLMMPSSEILISLANALSVKVDYFFRKQEVNLNEVNFRKKSKLPKKKENSIKQITIDFLERYSELEKIMNIENRFSNPLKGIVINNQDDVEEAAEKIRREWKLGEDPIPNVVEMLEEKSVKVLEVDEDKVFDGLSSWVENIPLIVINKNFDLVRKRFTALHELGHLILEFDIDMNENGVEKLCHSLAGAILIPKKSILNLLGVRRKNYSLNEFIAIKEYYGISIQALMARAFKVGLINMNQFKSFRINWNRLDYRINEPGSFQGEEKSKRFKNLVYHAAAENLVTINKAAVLLNMKLSEFQNDFKVL